MDKLLNLNLSCLIYKVRKTEEPLDCTIFSNKTLAVKCLAQSRLLKSLINISPSPFKEHDQKVQGHVFHI